MQTTSRRTATPGLPAGSRSGEGAGRWYWLMVVWGGAVGVVISPLRRGITGDTLWHLRAGQWMWAHHRILTTDPFSWTRWHQPWINLEWGWDLVSAALVRGMGPIGLVGWLVSTMGIVAYVQRKRWTAVGVASRVQGDWAAVLMIGLATFWAWRPQLVSYAMAPLWLWTLEAAERRPRALWWLGPELLIWQTLHGGYLLGLGLWGVWLGERLWRRRGVTRREAGRWLGVTAVLGGVLGLTPWGWGDVRHAVAVARNPIIAAHIAEWQSPNFHQLWWAAVFGGPIVAIAIRLYRDPAARHRLTAFQWLTWVLCVGATLLAVRNYPFFIEQTALVGAAVGVWPTRRTRAPYMGWAFWGAAVGTGLLLAGPFARPWFTVHTGIPNPVVTIVQQQPGRVLNGYRLGDGLLYRHIPVSIDGRADLYMTSAWLQVNLAAEAGQIPWPQLQAWLMRQHIRYIVWPVQAAGAKEVMGRPGVQTLYQGSGVVLLAVTAPRPGRTP